MSESAPTLARLKREIHRIDPKLAEKDLAFKAALVMLAALTHGQDERVLATFTGVPLVTVKLFARRLRRNKVWRDGKTYCGWFNEKSGGIEFWMDVGIALGLMERAQ